jgi:uncharacterized UPF0146 family protein
MDDVTMPVVSLYDDRDIIYSMRPPPELIPYMKKLAETISADLIVKPLSTDSIDEGRLIRYGNTTFLLWKFTACLHPVYGSRVASFNRNYYVKGISDEKR